MDDDPIEEVIDGKMEPYPTQKSGSDWAHSLSQGGVGAVPFLGGALAEVIEQFWAPALQKRQQEWLQDLGERFEALSESHNDLKQRMNEEAVLTVAIKATRAAMSTHEDEKRKALRNAVLNCALRIEPDEQIQQILTELIDRLTQAHLQLLAFMAGPGDWYDSNDLERPSLGMGSPSALLEKAFPRWNKEFYRLLAEDLGRLGLINNNVLNMTMSGDGVWNNHATGLGRRLLRFITDPE